MYKIISIILLVLVGAAMTWGITQCKAKKGLETDLIEADEDRLADETYYLACIEAYKNAKIKTDTIRDTIPEYLGWKYREKELTPADSQRIYNYFAINLQTGDTMDIFEVMYEDTLITPDFELYWYAKVVGYMKELGFPGYKLYVEKIIKEHVVEIPPKPVDPVIEYVYRKGWYITGAVGNDFTKWTSWTSIEGGVGYMTRKGVSFGVDYQHLSLPCNDEKIFGNFGKIRINYFFGK